MSITSVVNATTTNLGLVGDRELVAVQTIDIARFTTHIAPIVPGSFVAVSGRGPKNDSNGSGKTSFQSVVTVLLGDPQWRFDINGALRPSACCCRRRRQVLKGSSSRRSAGTSSGSSRGVAITT